MQDDKYAVRCKQLYLTTEPDNGVTFHQLQHQDYSLLLVSITEVSMLHSSQQSKGDSNLEVEMTEPPLKPQHASQIMIPKVLIEINRCHSTYLVTVCLIYEATVPSDSFNTDIIPNNTSKLKDYPIVLAWY